MSKMAFIFLYIAITEVKLPISFLLSATWIVFLPCIWCILIIFYICGQKHKSLDILLLSVSIMKLKINLSLQYSFWGLYILQEINMNIERKYGNCPWSKVFHMSTLRQCNIHLIEYVLYLANNIVFIFCIKRCSLKFWLCKSFWQGL